MPECDDCSCDRNGIELCETCGGTGRVSKRPVFFKLTKEPKETVMCADCNGTGIKQEEKSKGW